MRPKTEIPLVRRTLSMHERTMDRLDALRENTEAASDSDVVRKALLYYEQLLEDVSSGWKLFIRNVDGQEFAVPIPGPDSKDELPNVKKLTKRNIVLHENSARRLDSLRLLTNATSDSELVRNALTFYETLVDYELDGKRLVARNDRLQRETTYFIPVSKSRRPSEANWYSRVLAGLRAG